MVLEDSDTLPSKANGFFASLSLLSPLCALRTKETKWA